MSKRELHLSAVEQLADDDFFHAKNGFKLQAHMERCLTVCKVLRNHAKHIKDCNRGVGTFRFKCIKFSYFV